MVDLDLAPPPQLGGTGRPRLAALRGSRPLAATTMVLLALLTLGGAAPPAPPLTTVLTVGGTTAALALDDSALFTASAGGAPSSRAGIRRHALSDGSVQWAAQVPHGVESLTVSGDVLLARSFTDTGSTFLDAGTGRVLWHSAETNTHVADLTAYGPLMITDLDDGTRLRLADLHTGRTLWSRVLSPATRLGYDVTLGEPTTRLTAVTAGGRATVYSAADGTQLATADLGVRLYPRYGDAGSNLVEVSTSGDTVYVSTQVAGDSTLTAYGLDDLRPRWRATGTPAGQVTQCAGLLCVAGEQGLAVLDSGSGTLRWTRPSLRYGYDVDAGRRLPAQHRLIAFDGQDAADGTLIDAATGRVVQRLGRTLPIGRLLLRSDSVVPGRTWVSAPDERGDFRRVGSLDTSSPFACAAVGRHLACPGTTGPTTVWRIP